jgi:outer membrane immunogenic protein
MCAFNATAALHSIGYSNSRYTFMTGDDMNKALIAIAALATLIGGSALAADMPLKAPPAPPAPVDVWTGGYVGLNVGADWSHDGFNSQATPGPCTAPVPGCTVENYSNLIAQAATFNSHVNHSGVIGGGQAGYNWKVNNAVFGVEIDFQGMSDSRSATITTSAPSAVFPAQPVNQTATLNERINTLGTFRGRAGVLASPNALIYVTGGLAFASVRASAVYNQDVPFVGGGAPNIFPYGSTASASSERFGAVVGGGIEWKCTPNLSIKAEYLYVDLGNLTSNTTLQNPVSGVTGFLGQANVSVTTHVHDNIARVGFNYRLQ